VDHHGNTPLHSLLLADVSSDVITYLIGLRQGCDLQIKNADGDTPLHIACHKGQFAVINLIIGMTFDHS
jgi:ankyrin repeat protein